MSAQSWLVVVVGSANDTFDVRRKAASVTADLGLRVIEPSSVFSVAPPSMVSPSMALPQFGFAVAAGRFGGVQPHVQFEGWSLPMPILDGDLFADLVADLKASRVLAHGPQLHRALRTASGSWLWVDMMVELCPFADDAYNRLVAALFSDNPARMRLARELLTSGPPTKVSSAESERWRLAAALASSASDAVHLTEMVTTFMS